MYYVLSDIHGCNAELTTALNYWNPAKETLIVMGDLIDRGPDSLGVIRTLMQAEKDHPERVIVLAGNHDQMFLDWVLHTAPADLDFYYSPSLHDATIKSFVESDTANEHNPDGVDFTKMDPEIFGSFITRHFSEELAWLRRRDLFHETDHAIFVHAGINLDLPEWWHDTRSLTHIRSPFIYSNKIAEKRVFFGHTTTVNMHGCKKHNGIWKSEHGDKIGIDGGVSFGGQLNAVRVTESGHVTCVREIPSRLKQTKKEILRRAL